MSLDTSIAPISYSIDKELGIIFEVWNGNVSAPDLREYWQAYLADPDVMSLRTTHVDLRNAIIGFTGAEMAELVSSVVMPVLDGRDWKTAIVVGRPAQFGLSRQYQVFAEQYSTDCIFYDYAEALSWLRAQRSQVPR